LAICFGAKRYFRCELELGRNVLLADAPSVPYRNFHPWEDNTSLGRIDGVNLIGYVSGNAGLGVAARSIISLLLDKGIPVAVHDVEAGLGRSKHDKRFESLTVNSATELPYSVNIFVCDPISLSTFITRERVPILDSNCLNVGIIFWELPVFI
jgi:hypothetical protein